MFISFTIQIIITKTTIINLEHVNDLEQFVVMTTTILNKLGFPPKFQWRVLCKLQVGVCHKLSSFMHGKSDSLYCKETASHSWESPWNVDWDRRDWTVWFKIWLEGILCIIIIIHLNTIKSTTICYNGFDSVRKKKCNRLVQIKIDWFLLLIWRSLVTLVKFKTNEIKNKPH